MTVSRKLFVAAALLAVGYGVASLFGKPALRTHVTQFASVVLQQQSAGGTPAGAADPAVAAYRSDARLVPDSGTEKPNPADLNSPLVAVAPALLPNADSALHDSANLQHVPADENAAAIMHAYQTNVAPRVKLRNEAPRPLAIQARLPVIIERLPPSSPVAVASASAEEQKSSADWPTGFAQSGEFAPAISASYVQPTDSTSHNASIAPPPWSTPAEDDAPRTHVVVDGDSLAKLAGRYLDDPHRSGEIYQLNRNVLTDPDLLPIGAELAIPTQTGAPAGGGQSPQSFVPRAVASHRPAYGGLVPVRPVPSSAGVMPRAQLSRPLPVE